MSTTAATVKAAIEATIADITPTLEDSLKFRLLSEDMELPEDDAGSSTRERVFDVWHAGAESPSDITFDGYHDDAEYEVREQFRVTLAYPLTSNLRALDNRMRSDVRDIKSALDSSSNWTTDVLLQQVTEWAPPQYDKDRGAFFQTLTVYVRFLEAY